MKELDLVMVLPTQSVLEEMQQERFEVDCEAEPEATTVHAASPPKAPSKVAAPSSSHYCSSQGRLLNFRV